MQSLNPSIDRDELSELGYNVADVRAEPCLVVSVVRSADGTANVRGSVIGRSVSEHSPHDVERCLRIAKSVADGTSRIGETIVTFGRMHDGTPGILQIANGLVSREKVALQ